MKTSIVMTTYNGEKYVVEQMKSIFNQNIKADEVLIFDDCSSDHTCELISEFILKNELSQTWKFSKNSKNKGI